MSSMPGSPLATQYPPGYGYPQPFYAPHTQPYWPPPPPLGYPPIYSQPPTGYQTPPIHHQPIPPQHQSPAQAATPPHSHDRHVCCSCVPDQDLPDWFRKGSKIFTSTKWDSVGEFKQTIQEIVTKTTDPNQLGKGKDVRDRWYNGRLDDAPCCYEALKVISIERIQNPKLWRSYTAAKQDIAEKMSKAEIQIDFKTSTNPPLCSLLQPALNEGYVYHAASYPTNSPSLLLFVAPFFGHPGAKCSPPQHGISPTSPPPTLLPSSPSSHQIIVMV